MYGYDVLLDATFNTKFIADDTAHDSTHDFTYDFTHDSTHVLHSLDVCSTLYT